jgi:hypothetical protein
VSESPLVNNLNSIKKYSVDICSLFAKELVDIYRRNKEKKQPLKVQEFRMLVDVIGFVISQLAAQFVLEFKALEYPRKELPHADLCRAFVSLLASIVRVHAFYPQALEMRSLLLFDLCLPLLLPPVITATTSASDFIARREDLINRQEMNSMGNTASRLVEAYLDRIDGSVTFLTKGMIDLVKFHLTANPNHFNSMPP